MGGYDDEWEGKSTMSDCVKFVRNNPNFDRESPWMQFFNPGKFFVSNSFHLYTDKLIFFAEWESQKTDCAEEMQKFIDATPESYGDFLKQNKNKQFRYFFLSCLYYIDIFSYFVYGINYI